MGVSRRTFLQAGIGIAGWYLTAPHSFLLNASAAEFTPRVAGKSKILVLIQMGGGNDGLNTVVPYADPAYYKARPTIGIAADKVLPLDKAVGFHPAMNSMHSLFSDGKVAVLQNVGYPNPNRSHFRSIEIWQTAMPDRIGDSGWLGRYLECSDCSKNGNIFAAVNVEPTLPKTLQGSVMVPSVSNVFDFTFRTDPQYLADRATQLKTFDDIYSSFSSKRPHADLLKTAGAEANKASDYLQRIVRSYKGSTKYPDGNFGNGMKFISQMIAGGVNSRIFTVNLDGFDTHTNQLSQQNRLLKQLSEGVSSFYRDLSDHGLQDDVVVMAFSEFGRRVSENNGRGTDHGTAAPVYIIGSKVKGGVYGDAPNLVSLDDGDLKYHIDFRTVYATLLDRWLAADSAEVLGSKYDYIPFV